MNKNDLSWLKNTIQMLERPDNHDIDEKTISDIKKSLKLIKPRCVSENDRKLILVVESLADSYRFNYEDNSYITKCYKLFWVTQGRASRAEYWYFWLFTTLLSIGAVIIDNIAGTANSESGWGIVLP